MALLFDVEGEDLDRGYMNLPASRFRQEQEIVRSMEEMWAEYEPYADPDFREGFARDPDSRFWEMILGCYLLDAGMTLVPTAERY